MATSKDATANYVEAVDNVAKTVEALYTVANYVEAVLAEGRP